MDFELHPNLMKKDFVADLPLCRVLLEDVSFYPWLLLVPRRFGVARLIDLELSDQLQLLSELELAQQLLWNSFELTQLNVASLGNKTPQLHIHVIGRKDTDPAWPNTVWDHPIKTPYSTEQKVHLIQLFQEGLLAPAMSLKC